MLHYDLRWVQARAGPLCQPGTPILSLSWRQLGQWGPGGHCFWSISGLNFCTALWPPQGVGGIWEWVAGVDMGSSSLRAKRGALTTQS